MYRPEGLENPYRDEVEVPVIADLPAMRTMMHRAWETGANDYARALLDKGLRVNNLGDIPQGPGTVIFIPDEQ